MQKIDAHSHVGYFGGWADVGYTDEQMVARWIGTVSKSPL